MNHVRSFPIVSFLVFLASPAMAHVTLERGEAPVGSHYKATLRVPHGCAGAATNTLRVRIPDGMISVKPMPKPGWKLETANGSYEKPYMFHGAPVTEGVKEIIWSGGNLPDAHYDEFVFQGYLTDDLKPETTLYIPAVQECGSAAERWIEIPANGKSARDYKKPAPALRLIAKP